MSRTTTSRVLAIVCIVGLVVAVVATVLGHLGLGPGFNPLALTISDYALSDRGGDIEVAMVALAGGSLALLAGLAAARAPVRGLPTVLLLVWGVGLLIAAIVPTDPPGVASMSTAAYVHRYASVAGFVSLPIAAAILAHRFRARQPWAKLCSSLQRLTLICGVGLAVFWYVAFPGGRVLMGLVERSLIAVEIVTLSILALGLLRFAAPARAGLSPAATASARPVAAAAYYGGAGTVGAPTARATTARATTPDKSPLFVCKDVQCDKPFANAVRVRVHS